MRTSFGERVKRVEGEFNNMFTNFINNQNNRQLFYPVRKLSAGNNNPGNNNQRISSNVVQSKVGISNFNLFERNIGYAFTQGDFGINPLVRSFLPTGLAIEENNQETRLAGNSFQKLPGGPEDPEEPDSTETDASSGGVLPGGSEVQEEPDSTETDGPSGSVIDGPPTLPGNDDDEFEVGPQDPPESGTQTGTGRTAGKAVIVELDDGVDDPTTDDGYDDDVDHAHATSVEGVFGQYNPNGESSIVSIIDGFDPNASTLGNPEEIDLETNADILNYSIDQGSTIILDAASQTITDVVANSDESVINMSLGFTRNNVYENTLLALKDNPELGAVLGFEATDIAGIEVDANNMIDIDTVPDDVLAAVKEYVDNRLDAPGSAHQQALANYQRVTNDAADAGVVVVVAAGNDRQNSVRYGSGLGADTNFLAQSFSVVSVAASDDNGTETLEDDTIADFSSRGDGRFEPTITASGVDIETGGLLGTADGTSFAAPQVAGIISRIQQTYPDMTFNQIVGLLRSTAFDTEASDNEEGAGLLNPTFFDTAGNGAVPQPADPGLLEDLQEIIDFRRATNTAFSQIA
jgi:hypothetical protein